MSLTSLLEETVLEVTNAVLAVDESRMGEKMKLVTFEEDDSGESTDCMQMMKASVRGMLKVPEEVHKMILYNMMIDANILIDHPTTDFYRRLPDMLVHFGNLLNKQIFLPAYADTLLWALPTYEHGVRSDPGLEIVQYDKETKKIRRFEVSVSIGKSHATRQLPVAKMYEDPESAMNVTVTPFQVCGKSGKTAPEYVSLAEFERMFSASLQPNSIPVISTSAKRKLEEFVKLTPCEMASNILKKNRTEVRIVEK